MQRRPNAVGLSPRAANVYGYFESREDVLLQLRVEEARDLGERLEQAFASLGPGDVAGVIAAVVSTSSLAT
jgi:hypothetical protein